jgi:hypothetical protein
MDPQRVETLLNTLLVGLSTAVWYAGSRSPILRLGENWIN